MTLEEKIKAYVAKLGPRDKKYIIIHEGTDPLRLEIRSDQKLGKLLADKYESVMPSRYFGKGGIEIVCSGQLTEDEVIDLVRLGYELSA